MEFKVSSSKSQGVKKLQALFPGAGWSAKPSTEQPESIMLDSLQGLIGFTAGTGRDCAMRVSYLAREYIEKDCPTVIMCFDRQEHVPVAKAAEQAMRTKSVRKTMEDKAAISTGSFVSYRELPPPGIWFDKLLPDDFTEGLQDREGYRREVIRFLCKQWIRNGDPRVRFQPGGATKVILSGHCIREEDLADLGLDEDDWQALGLGAGDDPEDVPIVIESDTFYFCRDLRHKIGEGESQFFHFLEQMRPSRALLVSTDSDVLFHSLSYLSIRRATTVIDWRYDSRQPTRLFCHVNQLARDISAGKIHTPALERGKRKGADYTSVVRRWIAQEHPVMQIVAAQALAGTDYTQGFLKVTHDAVFEALLLASDKIGSLIPQPGKSDASAEAYVRLLVASWIQARLPGLELAPSVQGPRMANWQKEGLDLWNRSGDVNPQGLEFQRGCAKKRAEAQFAEEIAKGHDPDKMRIAWKRHSITAWEHSQRFEARYRFPHPVDDASHFANRILRWVYYLNMQMQLGAAAFVLDRPERWGYGPLDQEVTRENIYPLLDEAPPGFE